MFANGPTDICIVLNARSTNCLYVSVYGAFWGLGEKRYRNVIHYYYYYYYYISKVINQVVSTTYYS